MSAWSKAVVEQVVEAGDGKTIWLAYSGGIDSHVLLHCLATSPEIDNTRLHAIHINHQLNPESPQWAKHCADVAHALQIQLTCLDVDVVDIEVLGVEAAARQARYQAIASCVGHDDIVLTAQHQQDQAETLLLQLLRGSGVKGLSAMATISSLGQATLCRPMLAVTQSSIEEYAKQYSLQWIDDPSNQDKQLNRNYIRHQIFPPLLARWPSAASTLSRSAAHCADADDLLADLGEIDLSALNVMTWQDGVPVAGLLSLSKARACNALRTLLHRDNISLPSTAILQRVIDEVCLADVDKIPQVSWSGGVIRRYRDILYYSPPETAVLLPLPEVLYQPDKVLLSRDAQLDWIVSDNGIPMTLFQQGIRIRYRQGGERIQLLGRQHHHQLKQLWQDWAVPPWKRCRIPLLFCGDRLLAVADYALSQDCALGLNEQGYMPVVRRLK